MSRSHYSTLARLTLVIALLTTLLHGPAPAFADTAVSVYGTAPGTNQFALDVGVSRNSKGACFGGLDVNRSIPTKQGEVFHLSSGSNHIKSISSDGLHIVCTGFELVWTQSDGARAQSDGEIIIDLKDQGTAYRVDAQFRPTDNSAHRTPVHWDFTVPMSKITIKH